MVEAARERHSDPRARFEVGTEVREEVDYVLASGTFTLRAELADADWEAHVRACSEGLWERSRRGLGFNLLARGVKDGRAGPLHGRPGNVGGVVLTRTSRRAGRAALRPAAARLHRPRAAGERRAR